MPSSYLLGRIGIERPEGLYLLVYVSSRGREFFDVYTHPGDIAAVGVQPTEAEMEAARDAAEWENDCGD